jgi:hypothetical protein
MFDCFWAQELLSETLILCDDPQFFFSQYLQKNKFSRDVLLKFLNFDFFTNRTVE